MIQMENNFVKISAWILICTIFTYKLWVVILCKFRSEKIYIWIALSKFCRCLAYWECCTSWWMLWTTAVPCSFCALAAEYKYYPVAWNGALCLVLELSDFAGFSAAWWKVILIHCWNMLPIWKSCWTTSHSCILELPWAFFLHFYRWPNSVMILRSQSFGYVLHKFYKQAHLAYFYTFLFSKEQRYMILVVRKAVFRREIEVRVAATSAIVHLILSEQKIGKMESDSVSSQASCSQQAEVNCLMGVTLFQELRGPLRRCLSQQV